MLLTITLNRPDAETPATDLGYLLYKHPDKLQRFDVSTGVAHVFYPEATPDRCTAALLLEVDPIALVRGKKGGSDHKPSDSALEQYVNDRPYAASSMVAVALAKVFRTAMSGRCDTHQALADASLPLEIRIPALPSAGGAEFAIRCFEPLGWQVTATTLPADPSFPAWGDSRYVELVLTGSVRLKAALEHLYVLLPVLDNAKHYWVGTDEVEKLIRVGGGSDGWLADHPEREAITRRYLTHRRSLVTDALDQLAVTRLAESDDVDSSELPDATEPAKVTHTPLVAHRKEAVKEALRASGARSVLDLGCGNGQLTGELLKDPSLQKVAGVDVSPHALAIAARRLRGGRISEHQASRLTLFQSSLTYRDKRLEGYDAAILMEVIEHLDPPRLPALESNVFGSARPSTVIVTTPNVEYNVRYDSLAAGEHRHRDHRFEWTRAEFRSWAERVASTYHYAVRFVDVGEVDDELGSPTQLAVFTALAGQGNTVTETAA